MCDLRYGGAYMVEFYRSESGSRPSFVGGLVDIKLF